MSIETRTLLRRDFCYAVRMLREAMDDLVKISGSSGLMDDNPVQRCWRDVHAISSHVVMNWDSNTFFFFLFIYWLGWSC